MARIEKRIGTLAGQSLISVKSRSGHIITLGKLPVTWGSKLQTEIATSTMHAEYISLSMSLRDLLPIRGLIQELKPILNLPDEELGKVVRVWEDNQGAAKLATSPSYKTTPQSKHFAVKYHWFRDTIKNENISIQWIETKEQKADIFTKGLGPQEFAEKRKMIMGW